ncbi:hypothetical protein M8494_07615 [Serratia ureilytica]
MVPILSKTTVKRCRASISCAMSMLWTASQARCRTNPAIAVWLQRVGGYSAKLLLRELRMPISKSLPPTAPAVTLSIKTGVNRGFRRASPIAPIDAPVGSRSASASPLIVSADAVNGELSEDDIHLSRCCAIVDRRGVALPDNVEAYRNRMAQHK